MSNQENISIHWNFAGLDTPNSRKVIEAEIDIITRDILPNQFLELCKIIYQQLTVAYLSQVSMAEFWQLVAGENPDAESKRRATWLINALIRSQLAAKNPPDIPDGPSAYYLKREVLELLFSTNSLKELSRLCRREDLRMVAKASAKFYLISSDKLWVLRRLPGPVELSENLIFPPYI